MIPIRGRPVGLVSLEISSRPDLHEGVLQYIDKIKKFTLGDRAAPIIIQHVKEEVDLVLSYLRELLHPIRFGYEVLERFA